MKHKIKMEPFMGLRINGTAYKSPQGATNAIVYVLMMRLCTRLNLRRGRKMDWKERNVLHDRMYRRIYPHVRWFFKRK